MASGGNKKAFPEEMLLFNLLKELINYFSCSTG